MYLATAEEAYYTHPIYDTHHTEAHRRSHHGRNSSLARHIQHGSHSKRLHSFLLPAPTPRPSIHPYTVQGDAWPTE